MKMASLTSGVLMKLVEEMGMPKNPLNSLVLLQIRGIIPVLAEGNLWPNHGFYLKVSDSSHAIYVTLPVDQNDMILSNELQLGQYISARNLEMSHPVPILKGVTPLPGKYPCFGTPQDLVLKEKLAKSNNGFLSDSISTNGVSSDARSMMIRKSNTGPKFRSLSASRSCSNNNGERNSEILKEISKMRSSFVNKDSDTDSLTSSSCSSSITTRRSWDLRNTRNSIPRPRSAFVSPIRSTRSDSSDENPNCIRGRKHVVSPMKTPSKKRSSSVPRKIYEQNYKPGFKCSSTNDIKGSENENLWCSLPSCLVKYGKDVLRHRDEAILAAVEALEEASASDRLIRSLSSYSELQSTMGDQLRTSIDKFLAFQNDISDTRLIISSLTKVTTGSMQETELERRTHAASWIKSAISSDLSPVPFPISSGIESLYASSKTTNLVNKPRFATKKTKSEYDLINSLQNESRSWFLGYVENHLDGLKNKEICMESNSHEIMYQFKRVNDWLDGFCALNENEKKACTRVKSMIYEMLLNYVEKNAMKANE